jgi:beta-lactamase regulating signal transducer with metallopeptidase domain
MTASSDLFVAAHAASARIVTAVYATALVAALPLLAAAASAWLARKATADARATVWRSAIVALLVVVAGRGLPMHWVAWVVPSFFAQPLVALGRVQVTADSSHSAGALRDGATGAGAIAFALVVIYVAGVAVVGLRTLIAWHWLQRRVRATGVVNEPLSRMASRALGRRRWRRTPRVITTPAVAVPVTWGWRRPVIALPAGWHDRREPHTRMALMHELAHVASSDWAFYVAGRVVCALLWFHPGVWWIARALRDDCEQASDDRVIAGGIRRSDYAELLVRAADLGHVVPASAALALSRRRRLRARLAAVLDTSHDVRPLARGRALAMAFVAIATAAPISVVQLAPTRDVLTNLMLSAQWESRAYAVLGLAERPDSVAVARSAAERDPSPRVRAWARYALDRRGVLPALLPLTREP